MKAYYGQNELGFDVERDLNYYAVLIRDGVHFPTPPVPLYACVHCNYCSSAFQHAAETLSLPGTKGWDWRLIDGYIYLTVPEPKPEELPQREKLFRERIRPMIDDPWGHWLKRRDEALALYKPIKEADIEKVSDIELYEMFFQAFHVHRRWMEIHFLYDYGLHEIYHLFEILCEELTGIKPEDPLFMKLMAGFDNYLFQAEKDTWQISTRAKELGVADMFLSTEDDEEVMSKLEQSEAGRKWLAEYSEFLKVHGWKRSIVWDWIAPTWIEKPSLGTVEIRKYLAKGGDFVPEVERQRLVKAREEAETKVMTKVPSDQREWFEKLLRATQMSGSWTEEHNYYLDFMGNAVSGKVIKEIGRRFAKDGVIDDPLDIFWMMPLEIQRALIIRERFDIRPAVKARREEWEKYCKTEPPPPVLGNMERFGEIAVKDAVIRTVAAPPMVRPELKADLYGAGSAPGVVEGIARVVASEAELKNVQPGEILVAPFTSASWTYIFGVIAGVVTDSGGSLVHAVIVGREYGIPAVAGTMEGTKKIKSGDRIRVDGDMATVYILAK
jgi:pyruvate,water dikinase